LHGEHAEDVDAALAGRRDPGARASSRWRPAARAITRGASMRVIQWTSAEASRWSVPRIGHVRTIARVEIARSTTASVAPRTRWPMPHSAAR